MSDPTIAGIPARAYYDANYTLPQLWRLTDDLLDRMAKAERDGDAAGHRRYTQLFHAVHDVIDAKERRRDERQRRRQARAITAWSAS